MGAYKEIIIMLVAILGFRILVNTLISRPSKSYKRYKVKRKETTVAAQKGLPKAEIQESVIELDTKNAYKPTWLFSQYEKGEYLKIKQVADELGLYVFAKVRLLDLLEPIKGTAKYKTYFYKVQAKHVDFVICDKKLVARCILEIDDNSHLDEERKERDRFVDEVLKSTGYKVFRGRSIHTDSLREVLKQVI